MHTKDNFQRTCFFGAVLLFLAACYNGNDTEEERKCAQALWKDQRSVVDKYVNDESVDEGAFNDALDFFSAAEEVTEIQIRWNIVGTLDLLLVSEETQEDLIKLDAWYERHHTRLKCTSDKKRVVLDRQRWTP